MSVNISGIVGRYSKQPTYKSSSLQPVLQQTTPSSQQSPLQKSRVYRSVQEPQEEVQQLSNDEPSYMPQKNPSQFLTQNQIQKTIEDLVNLDAAIKKSQEDSVILEPEETQETIQRAEEKYNEKLKNPILSHQGSIKKTNMSSKSKKTPEEVEEERRKENELYEEAAQEVEKKVKKVTLGAKNKLNIAGRGVSSAIKNFTKYTNYKNYNLNEGLVKKLSEDGRIRDNAAGFLFYFIVIIICICFMLFGIYATISAKSSDSNDKALKGFYAFLALMAGISFFFIFHVIRRNSVYNIALASLEYGERLERPGKDEEGYKPGTNIYNRLSDLCEDPSKDCFEHY